MTAGEPRVLVAAGLDPSGRAGMLADVATLGGLGVTALGVVTALTAQGTRTFAREAVQTRMLEQQLLALEELGAIHAVKLGLVPSREVLRVLRRRLGRVETWVVDPVVVSSRGERLSELEPRDYLALAAEGTVLTPNLPELQWLTGIVDLEEAAESLLARGFGGVVVKGGHGGARAPVRDVVVTRARTWVLEVPRQARAASTRGTGCRHASALTAGRVKGQSLLRAARTAQRVVGAYLRGR